MDKLTPEQRKKNMRAVKSKGSIIEKELASSLWKKGIRYRKNYSKIIGKPDFAITKYKIAVFCDSEFWHGKDWENKKNEIKSNKDFWLKKIEGNIKRDISVNKELSSIGWTVVRFWGNDIKKDAYNCSEIVKNIIEKKKINQLNSYLDFF
jgi:DNA mismatch endonuclease Vsr